MGRKEIDEIRRRKFAVRAIHDRLLAGSGPSVAQDLAEARLRAAGLCARRFDAIRKAAK